MQHSEHFKCQSCATDYTLVHQRGKGLVSACPVCGFLTQPHPSQEQSGVLPQVILPFERTRAQVEDAFRQWAGKIWFAPRDFAAALKTENAVKPIYLPYWIFRGPVTVSYTGKRGDVYYQYRETTDSKQDRVRRIDWDYVQGRTLVDVHDAPVLAMESTLVKYMDALGPWSLRNAVPFSDMASAGQFDETYYLTFTCPEVTAAKGLKDTLESDVRKEIRRAIGGDEQRISSYDLDTHRLDVQSAFLPGWSMGYSYNGKSYQFLYNDQTGEVQAQRPISILKVALAAGAALAVVAAVALGGWFLSQDNAKISPEIGYTAEPDTERYPQ
jgi:hypothetical protein